MSLPRPLGRIAAPLFLSAALGSCGADAPDPHDDLYCEAALKDPDSLDAFDWLKTPSPGPKMVVGMGTDDGLAFAHILESRGAKRVVAVRVRAVTRGQSAPASQTAEGLLVELPRDAGQRHALFTLYAKQAREAGFAPRADAGQKYLLIPSKP